MIMDGGEAGEIIAPFRIPYHAAVCGNAFCKCLSFRIGHAVLTAGRRIVFRTRFFGIQQIGDGVFIDPLSVKMKSALISCLISPSTARVCLGYQISSYEPGSYNCAS
jgi:hypothetical protein